MTRDGGLLLAVALACTAIAAPAVGAPAAPAASGADARMYGLIGRMIARPGARDALIALLLDGIARMPGCLSYVVAKDSRDADAIWITEVWTDKAAHDAALALPAVRAAIATARPLIAGMDEGHETAPVGGAGLPRR